jgi:DNA-binding IclR family transcriptional regulator
MEIENKNYALSLFKILKSGAGNDGKVQVDMGDLCRAAGLEEEDVRECLVDLEAEGFISTEIVCTIAEEWR